MEPSEKDGAAVRLPPPLVYLVAVIIGGLLNKSAFPISLELALGVRVVATIAVAALGLGFMIGAVKLFKHTGQDPKPWQPTPEIISTGIYRYTRNPMYVALALLQIAIGLGLANGWVIVLVFPVLIIVDITAIRPEEAYLERKFGAAYTEYKNVVRRWL